MKQHQTIRLPDGAFTRVDPDREPAPGPEHHALPAGAFASPKPRREYPDVGVRRQGWPLTSTPERSPKDK